MRRRTETGSFKFQLGDVVCHEVCDVSGEIVDMGWSNELIDKGVQCMGRNVKICLVEDDRGQCIWLSEVLLRKVSPLERLAEAAE